MAETAINDDGDFFRVPANEAWTLLQYTTLLYYLHETNPDNLLVRDKTDPKAPVSIAAVGMALATIPVIVERGVFIREFAAKHTLKQLRYLLQCPQGPEPEASGYNGFFYHFLDIETGRRVWQCELSTIDSAFLFAGALTVATYFDRGTADETEIAASPMRSTSAPIGTGLAMAQPHSRTAGGRRADSSHTGGKATTKACCSTSWGWARPHIHCRRRVIAPTAQPTNGKASTPASYSTRARYLPINCHTCGSTFATFVTNS